MKAQSIFAKVTTVGMLAAFLITLTIALTHLRWSAQGFAMVPVTQPRFSTPDIGYYSSWVWPNTGWELIWGNPGDANSNPASIAAGATVKRTGMYSATGTNIVEAWCAPNYYWIYQGVGIQPFRKILHDASTTPTQGKCYFNATIGNKLRQLIPNVPTPPLAPVTIAYPKPAAYSAYSFDVTTFAKNIEKMLYSGRPTPVGYQLAVRDPQGKLVYSSASGSVTGSSSLPATSMTKERRFDVASMSKTIAATAVMAALEDLATHQPSLEVTLDSSIAPYVPSTWNKSKIGNVTFRSLLRQTSGFVANGGDSYDQVKTMVEQGPNAAMVGKWNYYNTNYSLLRIVLAYLVDGPAAYKPFESNATLNAQLTALSYRSYVRNRIFDPIRDTIRDPLVEPAALATIDEFYTGALPETI